MSKCHIVGNLMHWLILLFLRIKLISIDVKTLLKRSQKKTRYVEVLSSLSYDVASESEITSCIKINKPLVVYRFMGNVMMSIITLRTICQNCNVFTAEMRFQRNLSYMINRL